LFLSRFFFRDSSSEIGLLFGKEKKNRPALSPSLDKEFTADSRSALVGLDVAARPHFQLPRRQIIGQLL
jgi:hypothetical protein